MTIPKYLLLLFFLRAKLVAGQSVSKIKKSDVIKMREIRGKVGKKTPKKETDIPSFYDVTRLIFETLCPATKIVLVNFPSNVFPWLRPSLHSDSLSHRQALFDNSIQSFSYQYTLKKCLFKSAIFFVASIYQIKSIFK